jgi:hypothetical protein
MLIDTPFCDMTVFIDYRHFNRSTDCAGTATSASRNPNVGSDVGGVVVRLIERYSTKLTEKLPGTKSYRANQTDSPTFRPHFTYMLCSLDPNIIYHTAVIRQLLTIFTSLKQSYSGQIQPVGGVCFAIESRNFRSFFRPAKWETRLPQH